MVRSLDGPTGQPLRWVLATSADVVRVITALRTRTRFTSLVRAVLPARTIGGAVDAAYSMRGQLADAARQGHPIGPVRSGRGRYRVE